MRDLLRFTAVRAWSCRGSEPGSVPVGREPSPAVFSDRERLLCVPTSSLHDPVLLSGTSFLLKPGVGTLPVARRINGACVGAPGPRPPPPVMTPDAKR